MKKSHLGLLLQTSSFSIIRDEQHLIRDVLTDESVAHERDILRKHTIDLSLILGKVIESIRESYYEITRYDEDEPKGNMRNSS